MKTALLLMTLLLASTAQAASNQAQCPPDTLWNPNTNQCYRDPDSETAKREQREQAQREQERKCEEAKRAAAEYRQQLEKNMATSDYNQKLPPDSLPPECIRHY